MKKVELGEVSLIFRIREKDRGGNEVRKLVGIICMIFVLKSFML